MFVKQAIYRHTVIPTIAKSLDAAAMRDKAISNNMANINTPGYRRIEVSFERDLREALDKRKLQGEKTDSKHISLGRKDLREVEPDAYRSMDRTLPGEINNMDVDMEAAKLAENQLAFQFSIKFMNDQTQGIMNVIKDNG